ncbi:MAG: hypothetical protein ACYTEX_25635 [Planctomycetota bacterium]|jgi:hypothetical protein
MAKYRDGSKESRVTVSAEYRVEEGTSALGIPSVYVDKTLTKVFDSGFPIESIIEWLRCEVPLDKGAELTEINLVLESEALGSS